MIFAVFDVLLAVNMCINYSFFTFILCKCCHLIVHVAYTHYKSYKYIGLHYL